jgi:hypothetical protein
MANAVIATIAIGEMDRGTAEENRVAVGIGMRDRCRCHRTAGAGLIFNEHRAKCPAYFVGPRPADNVEYPAGWKRKYKLDRPRRIGLRAGKAWRGREREARRGHRQNPPARNSFHVARSRQFCRQANARNGTCKVPT